MAVITDRQLAKQLSDLRKLIEETDDVIVLRVAYTIECAVRRVTEDVVNCPTLEEQAYADAELLRSKLDKTGG